MKITQDRALTPLRIATGNALLAGLSRLDLRTLTSHLRILQVESGKVLGECGQPIVNMYFPITAVISLFSVSSEGSLIEAAIVGSEGVMGCPLVVTNGNLPFRAVVQVAGQIAQVPAKTAATVLFRQHEMQQRLGGYMNVFIVQLAQSAICNNRHTVEQRLARWLLAMRARSGLMVFSMTHEVLSHILGTTRPVVTIAAHTLKKADLIAYRRGILHITNPEGLAQAACPCYEIVHRELAAFLTLCDFESHPFFGGPGLT